MKKKMTIILKIKKRNKVQRADKLQNLKRHIPVLLFKLNNLVIIKKYMQYTVKVIRLNQILKPIFSLFLLTGDHLDLVLPLKYGRVCKPKISVSLQ